MSTQVLSAVQSEGVGNSNLTFLKKVTIVDETDYIAERSNNGGAYSYTKELYYFHGSHPTKGVMGYWRIAYKSNCSEFTTDSNGVFCDSLTYRNFGKIQHYELPLFKEQCHESEPECGQETPANIWDYLGEVTEEEFFFAKSAIVCRKIEGDQLVSWEFGRFDGYHE